MHAALRGQAANSRDKDEDARSTTSNSSRGQQRAARAATVDRSRAGKPRRTAANLADYIEKAFEERRQKAEQQGAAAAARAARTERRASGEGLLPPVDEQPAVRREASKASAGTGSPMSTTVEVPQGLARAARRGGYK